jgi:hypothetical protein
MTNDQFKRAEHRIWPHQILPPADLAPALEGPHQMAWS